RMFDLLRKPESGGGGDGDDLGGNGMADGDLWEVGQFLQDLVIDASTYIDYPTKAFLGDPVQGQIDYNAAPPMGGIACGACHGADGTAIDFDPGIPAAFVGTIAVENPWELLHKIRFGQPGAGMGSYRGYGGTDQSAADIGRYAQLNFPVDCTTPGHCDDGDPCTTDSCDGAGDCQYAPNPGCGLTGDPIRGGLLWDKWWVVNGAPAPGTDHPLWARQVTNTRTGSTTWRCKECHGWDYKGAAGAYGSGSHYTGFGGVFGSAMTAEQMFDLLKNPESGGDP
ncbi:MAG: hypothetical protein GY778_15400, partial [bacterium]|nr:hypothetical protein [bacterium]